MDHVIDVRDEGAESAVMTETGDGGLLGRALLHDQPLGAYVGSGESPQFVLRNRKRGVTIEGTDGAETLSPDGDHRALALITDCRVLFAIGHGGGDRTVQVPLADVVTARAEDGLLGSTLVVETVNGDRYEFPCRGSVTEVSEFVDRGAAVWTRAERCFERAEAALEAAQAAYDERDADAVLAAVAEGAEALETAEKEAAMLDGAAASVADRVAEIDAALAACERRGYVERAEHARSEAHAHWDAGEYEAAYDRLDDADAAYEAAAAIDAERPPDALLERRRESLAAERERLARAPLAGAENAVDVARAASDPETRLDWWERALDRYDTVLVLDWGRNDRRFRGDRATVRDRMATVAHRFVDAHCELATVCLENGDAVRESDPDAAALAYEEAESVLSDAESMARERAPDALEEVRAVAAELDDRREELAVDRADPAVGDGDDAEEGANDDSGSDSPDGASSGSRGAESSDPSDGSGEATDSDRDGEAERSIDATGEAATGEAPAADLADVDAAAFSSLVADLFRARGWSTTVFDASTDRQYDVLAETGGPVRVRAFVWTAHPAAVEAVDAATIERYAAFVDRSDTADTAVLASAAPLSPTARERAADHSVKLLDAESLAAELDRRGLQLADYA